MWNWSRSGIDLTPRCDGARNTQAATRDELMSRIREAIAQGKVSIRRLGSDKQEVMSLDAAVAALREEATPPDLKRAGGTDIAAAAE